MGTRDVGEPYAFHRRDAAKAIAAAAHSIEESFRIGGQEHFYLEGQVSMAVPEEHGAVTVHCSTQHPSEVQHLVAHMLHMPAAMVTIECRRMGGAFGGKESQAAQWACLAALAAHVTGRPAKCRLDRDEDMIMTGKRHDFRVDYKAGFDAKGRILGVDVDFLSRCGYSADLSQRHLRPRHVPCGQCLFLSRRAHRHAQAPDPHGFQHRLPRLRRSAGHALRRAHDGGDRHQDGRATRSMSASSICIRTSATSRPMA